MKKISQKEAIELLNDYVDIIKKTLTSPFPASYQGKEWYAASNGTEALMIKTQEHISIAPPDHTYPELKNILPHSYEEIPLSREVIYRVFNIVPSEKVDEEVLCDSCDGIGEFEHFGHTYDCEECGYTGLVNTGNKVLKKDESYAISVDGKHLDFKFFHRMYRLMELLQVESVSFLRQKENHVIIGFKFDDEVMVWIAGLSDASDLKVVVLPV